MHGGPKPPYVQRRLYLDANINNFVYYGEFFAKKLIYIECWKSNFAWFI